MNAMNSAKSQIKERRDIDDQRMSDSLLKAAGVVMGEESVHRAVDDRVAANNAIGHIMRYYRFKASEAPESVTDIHGQLDYCLRPHGVMYREVELQKGWYREAFSPILAFTKEEGEPIALIPGRVSGYWYTDPLTEMPVKLTAINAKQFDDQAICFYRPLPQKELGMADLIRYMFQCITVNDVVVKGAACPGS